MPLLSDGTEVASDSEAWRHHCEAATVVGMDASRRSRYLEAVEKKRGAAARQRIEFTAHDIEVEQIVALPSRLARQEAIAAIGRKRGRSAREAVEAAVLARWQQQKAG